VVNENPHRALSDALTAAKILQSLMAIDENLEIAKKLINRQETKVTLPNHTHPDDYKQLPSKPGVYLFYGEAGKPIYIGKAKNIKSRVSSHFNGDLSSKRTQAFMREIYSIDFIETGSELLAYLVEDSLIRKNWPKHNSAQKARVKKFGVISYLDQNRNYRLAVNPIRQNETAIKVFYYYSAAMQWLHEITVDYQLNPNYVGLLSLAASIEVGDKDHNERVLKLTQDFERSSNAVLLKLRGRSNKEDAWLLVENNSAAAYCFSEKGVVPEKEEMTLLMASATSEKILENYILKNPVNIYNFENEKINSL
jgi:DNA polymerase-3 subunit epsilon